MTLAFNFFIAELFLTYNHIILKTKRKVLSVFYWARVWTWLVLPSVLSLWNWVHPSRRILPENVHGITSASLYQNTNKSSIWWLCSDFITYLPQHEKKKKKKSVIETCNSSRMQRCFLLSSSGKAKMAVPSNGHSRPLLFTFEKTHLSIYIEKCIWINTIGLTLKIQ